MSKLLKIAGLVITTILMLLGASNILAASDNMMMGSSMTSDSQKAKEYFESKMAFTTGPVEVSKMMGKNSNMQIIDVRYAEDYAKGHVPGAISMPPDSWDSAMNKMSKDKTYVIYCYSPSCHLAAEAAAKFASQGFRVMEMEGGYKAWMDNKFKVEHTA